MNEKNLSNVLADFETYLRCEVENKDSTVNKYLSETKRFLKWLYDDKHLTVAEINKKIILSFKDYLCEKYNNPDTINGKLGMNHIFLKFLGIGDITVKRLKVVKRNCKPSGRYVKEVDFKKLIKCEKKKYEKAVIVAKIIANTGIRASIEALANILGHSSTETTLIYLRKTVEEYGITMDIWYKK